MVKMEDKVTIKEGIQKKIKGIISAYELVCICVCSEGRCNKCMYKCMIFSSFYFFYSLLFIYALYSMT